MLVYVIVVGGHDHRGHTMIGLWVLAGLLAFMIIEKMFPDDHDTEQDDEEEEKTQVAVSVNIMPHDT